MEQFDLSLWLKDKSRKIVTRTGEPVEIIDYKAKGDYCIYAKATWQDGETFNICTTSNGEAYKGEETAYDLFFADEEEELTEFEKELNRIVIAFSDAHAYMDKNEIHHYSKGLLDLARKELLKDLPKWKKMPNGIQGNGDFKPTYLVRTSNGHYFTTPCLSWDEDSMYIELSELEKLPKE